MTESDKKTEVVSPNKTRDHAESVSFSTLSQESDGPNILDYWRAFLRNKWKSLLIVVLTTGIAFIITALSPRKYTSEVALLPLGGGGGLSGLASTLGSLPLLGSQLGGLGSKKEKELMGILKSRTLSEKVIVKFDLLKELFPKFWDEKTQSFVPFTPPLESGVGVFQKDHLNVSEEKKTGIISVSVTMENPEIAAKVANTMILELQRFVENNALTVEKKNRIFIEKQLVVNRAKLLESGKVLSQFYADKNISSVVPELDVKVGTYQADDLSLEELKDEMLAVQNKEKTKLKKMENPVVSKVPGQVYLSYLAMDQELLKKTHSLLTSQFEIAKIEEAREDLGFQVIDWAKVRINPSSPNLKINLAMGFVIGFFFALTWIFFDAYISKIKENEARK